MDNFKKFIPILIVIVITILVFTYKESEPTSRPINNNDVDFETITTLPELGENDIYGVYSFNYKIDRDTFEQICEGYFLFDNNRAYLHICNHAEGEEKIYKDYTGQIGDNDGITCLSIQESYKRFIEYRVDDYSDENSMTLYLLTQSGLKYGISGNNEVGKEIILNKGTHEEYLNACKYFGIEIEDEIED